MAFILPLAWLGFSVFFLLQLKRGNYFKNIPPLNINIPKILLIGSFVLYFFLSVFASALQAIFIQKAELIQFLFSLFLTLAMLALAFINLSKKTLKKLFYVPKNFGKLLLYAIAAWLLIFPFIVVLSYFFDFLLSHFFKIAQLPEQIAVKYLKQTFHSPYKLTLAFIYILFFAPLIEEYLFRGVLLNFLQKYISVFQSIIFSSLIFAFFHFAPNQKAANLTIISCLFLFSLSLGFLYQKYKTLLLPIMLHTIFNLFTILNLLFFTK